MSQPVPPRARQLALALTQGFAADQQLAIALNEAQSRLMHANHGLWSGMHPDAVSLLYDHSEQVAGAADYAVLRSKVTAVMLDQRRLSADSENVDRDVETVVLLAVQEIHWAIHRAFVEYQRIAENRRHLAITIGEQTHEFVDVLTTAGWSEQEARNTNVEHIASSEEHDD